MSINLDSVIASFEKYGNIFQLDNPNIRKPGETPVLFRNVDDTLSKFEMFFPPAILNSTEGIEDGIENKNQITITFKNISKMDDIDNKFITNNNKLIQVLEIINSSFELLIDEEAKSEGTKTSKDEEKNKISFKKGNNYHLKIPVNNRNVVGTKYIHSLYSIVDVDVDEIMTRQVIENNTYYSDLDRVLTYKSLVSGFLTINNLITKKNSYYLDQYLSKVYVKTYKSLQSEYEIDLTLFDV